MATIKDHVPGSTPLPKIGQPATRALNAAGYYTLEQVSGTTSRQLLAMHGIGPKAIRILEEAFKLHGLSFAKEE
ncbi:hypothetical protein KTO58_13240 [Chitinophaga pendula]|uniref:hypothetical protein n=1 Tax=Chitinophaga TaxID=79328 RepID=UPI000BAF40E3|nr:MULTISPECIES: hypothetical protein [Chitinophaga]ASZ12295.1 hypothetical protein CK934_15660 [Chitinophaga sp. MD30]UCJ10116.1 hypothetical protein KTO58_13240 [Chitinophaga pendula]